MKELLFENKKYILTLEEFARTDSAMHMTWMFLIQVVLFKVFGKLSYIAPIVFAFGKEYYDMYFKNSRFCESDIIYTIIGGFLAILIIKNKNERL